LTFYSVLTHSGDRLNWQNPFFTAKNSGSSRNGISVEHIFTLFLKLNIVSCTPIARLRVGKEVPAKTDSW
jgi:hypothetical protein